MAVSCPDTYSLESHNSQVLPLVTRGVLRHVLKSIHKICPHSTQLYGVLKTTKEGWNYSNFTKGETILISEKLSVIWGNLTLHHSCKPFPNKTPFIQFGQVESIHGHLFEKIFLICFSTLSPQAEQKEDDEHFSNHLQM